MAKRSGDAPVLTAAKRQKPMNAETTTAATTVSQDQSPLFKVAGEIRNKIYYYALDMDQPRNFDLKAAERPVTRAFSNRRQLSTVSLLFTCKQVASEAGSLLYNHGSPCLNALDLLRPHPTSKRILESFMSVAIEYSPFRINAEKHDTGLLKLLDTFIAASPVLCADRERRRKASVRYVLSWNNTTLFSRCVEKMATDEFTVWEVRLAFSLDYSWTQSDDPRVRCIVWARNKCEEMGGRVKLVVELLSGVYTRDNDVTPEIRGIFAPQVLLEEERPSRNYWGIQNRRWLLRF